VNFPSGYTEQIEEMERFMKQTWEDKERDSQRHEDVVDFLWAESNDEASFGPKSLVSILYFVLSRSLGKMVQFDEHIFQIKWVETSNFLLFLLRRCCFFPLKTL